MSNEKREAVVLSYRPEDERLIHAILSGAVDESNIEEFKRLGYVTRYPTRACILCTAPVESQYVRTICLSCKQRYKPYSRATGPEGALELISFPFVSEAGAVRVMVREPDDPTTMREMLVSDLTVEDR